MIELCHLNILDLLFDRGIGQMRIIDFIDACHFVPEKRQSFHLLRINEQAVHVEKSMKVVNLTGSIAYAFRLTE